MIKNYKREFAQSEVSRELSVTNKTVIISRYVLKDILRIPYIYPNITQKYSSKNIQHLKKEK